MESSSHRLDSLEFFFLVGKNQNRLGTCDLMLSDMLSFFFLLLCHESSKSVCLSAILEITKKIITYFMCFALSQLCWERKIWDELRSSVNKKPKVSSQTRHGHNVHLHKRVRERISQELWPEVRTISCSFIATRPKKILHVHVSANKRLSNPLNYDNRVLCLCPRR